MRGFISLSTEGECAKGAAFQGALTQVPHQTYSPPARILSPNSECHPGRNIPIAGTPFVYYDTLFSWPLTRSCWRLFATWCQKIAAFFLSPLKFVHHITGVPCLDTKMIFCWIKSSASPPTMTFFGPPPPSTRRITSLLLLGQGIGSTCWPDLNRGCLRPALSPFSLLQGWAGYCTHRSPHSHLI